MNKTTLATGLILAVVCSSNSAQAQSTARVSVTSTGAQGNLGSRTPALSAAGRFVAFTSAATNLVTGDTNGKSDIFVHDRQLGTTELASVDSAGSLANGDSSSPAISADGRFVAFESAATNLVAGDANGTLDVFVHDRQTGTTERVSVGALGAEGNGPSLHASISADGRFVAFSSSATNLVAADTNACEDVFLRDRQLASTRRASVSGAGAQANHESFEPALCADGSCLAFTSRATNLVSGDSNGARDIFVHEFASGLTERVSVATGGGQSSYHCARPSISADGRCIAFESLAANLIAGDTNDLTDVFVHDRQGGITERVSVDWGGAQASGHSFQPTISPDGRLVAFYSTAEDLVTGDTNQVADVFVHDRQESTTLRKSIDSTGVQADGLSDSPALSADGRFVAFASGATNLVAGDSNGVGDVFVHDRGLQPGVDLCQPGSAGVSACPCLNPPQSAPRGCDNSSATGGARLLSQGVASLSTDSLVFVTSGERPSALSVVLQGTAEVGSGTTFGQGVLCVGGSLKRLYTANAAGGSIVAPGPGDPTVSARSATLGDSIGAGTNRWYAVYYRDPVALGFCPGTLTYNVTQTQRVAWGI